MSDELSYCISIHEDTYVRTIWYVGCERFNVLAWMYRRPGNPWEIGYRFRHYRDDKVFDSDDKRTTYRLTPKDGGDETDAELNQIAAAFDFTFEAMAHNERATFPGARAHRLDVDAVGLAAHAIIATAPWANMYAPGMTDTSPKPPGKA